jgi:hypothetical protein
MPTVMEFTEERPIAIRDDASTPASGTLPDKGRNAAPSAVQTIAWLPMYAVATAAMVVSVAEIISQTFKKQLAAKRNTKVSDLMDEVEHLQRTLDPDWNGYGSEPPSGIAVENARQVLLACRGTVLPTNVVASAQGGIGVCFYRGKKYGDIECLNTGEILATISDGSGRPKVWEVKPTEKARTLESIGKYLR